MTSVVALPCRDGVVIGADSAATLGDGGQLRTIEQETEKKIEVIGEQVIIAGTGFVGHGQRFCAVVKQLYDRKDFQGKTAIDIGKMISAAGINDFRQTHMVQVMYSAVVAYPALDQPVLCELPGGPTMFQPEIKSPDDLWFTSIGSGQPITDPFLRVSRDLDELHVLD